MKKTFRASHCSELYHKNYSDMDCKILRQYSLIIDPSIKTKQIDYLKVLDKETPLRTLLQGAIGCAISIWLMEILNNFDNSQWNSESFFYWVYPFTIYPNKFPKTIYGLFISRYWWDKGELFFWHFHHIGQRLGRYRCHFGSNVIFELIYGICLVGIKFTLQKSRQEFRWNHNRKCWWPVNIAFFQHHTSRDIDCPPRSPDLTPPHFFFEMIWQRYRSRLNDSKLNQVNYSMFIWKFHNKQIKETNTELYELFNV